MNSASEIAKLNAYLPEVLEIDGVVSAIVWEPTSEDMDEMPGVRPQLMVEASRSARGGNPSNVKADVSTAWLEQVSDGSGEYGPCWAWSVKEGARELWQRSQKTPRRGGPHAGRISASKAKPTKMKLADLEKKIQQLVKDAVLAPGTAIYLADDAEGNPTSNYRLDVHRYREHGRPRTEAGRAELATEEAAEAELVRLAGEIGTVTRDGDGSGEYGPITCYAVTINKP